MATMREMNSLAVGDAFYIGSKRWIIERVQWHGTDYRLWGNNGEETKGFLATKRLSQQITRITPADRVREHKPHKKQTK